MTVKAAPRGPRGHVLLGSGSRLQRAISSASTPRARASTATSCRCAWARSAGCWSTTRTPSRRCSSRGPRLHQESGRPPAAQHPRRRALRLRGRLWLRQRRLMQPAFHRQRVAAYGEVMAAYAARRAADWHDGDGPRRPRGDDGLTLAIVAKTLFDADVSDEARAIGDASDVLIEYFGERLGSLLAAPPAVAADAGEPAAAPGGPPPRRGRLPHDRRPPAKPGGPRRPPLDPPAGAGRRRRQPDDRPRRSATRS